MTTAVLRRNRRLPFLRALAARIRRASGSLTLKLTVTMVIRYYRRFAAVNQETRCMKPFLARSVCRRPGVTSRSSTIGETAVGPSMKSLDCLLPSK